MKKRRWLWAAAAVAALAAGALGWTLAHPTEGSKGLLYHVTGEKGQLYLLGSIHIGTDDMYPFGDEINRAMEQADTFVYECDTTSPEVVAGIRARMPLPEGQTLEGLIGDELYAELSQVCEELGLPTDTFNTKKPWAVINTLAVYATAAELDTANVNRALALGVERKVEAYAARNGKQTIYLETADEQTDVLEGFSDALKNYLLKSELDAILDPASVTGLDASIASWPEWWKNGDAGAFAAQYLSGYLAPGYEAECQEYHERLITERNRRMAQRLDALLSTGRTYFVTIGLLHLVLPEDSVIANLQALGYTVERAGESYAKP